MCCYIHPAIEEKLIPSIIKVLMCTMCVVWNWQKCPSPRLRDLLIIDLYAYVFLEISVKVFSLNVQYIELVSLHLSML